MFLGKPNQVRFLSEDLSRYKDSYNITWSVNSYTPIEEFRLYFRRVPENGIPDSSSYQFNKRQGRRVSGYLGGLTLGDNVGECHSCH